MGGANEEAITDSASYYIVIDTSKNIYTKQLAGIFFLLDTRTSASNGSLMSIMK